LTEKLKKYYILVCGRPRERKLGDTLSLFGGLKKSIKKELVQKDLGRRTFKRLGCS
jgi:hypothetical protein